jgi:hypothetical protein
MRRASLIVTLIAFVPASVRAQTMPPPQPPPTAPVEFRSTGGATQISVRPVLGVGAAPMFICETPCVVAMPLGAAQLEAGGAKQRPVAFGLMVSPPGLSVHVRPGSKAMYGSGVALTTTGLLALALATVAIGIGAYSWANASNSSGFFDLLGDAAVAYAAVGTGAVLALAGIALVVPGAILWSRSSGSVLKIEPLKPQLSLSPTGLSLRF